MARKRGSRKVPGSVGKPGTGVRSRAMRKAGMSGALIGWIGRKNRGAKNMAKWSAQGRKRAAARRRRARRG